MKVLITAGPTWEPIDSVRYIGNRSSGRMGAALVGAGIRAGHSVTVIAGPVVVGMPREARRVGVRTAAEMLEATLAEFEGHDLLIMAAAVADFRPKAVHFGKLARTGSLVIECEATADIVAAAGAVKKEHQRTVGFSLESEGDLPRAVEKLHAKKLDLMVFNSLATMESESVAATLIYPDGKMLEMGSASKGEFADKLTEKVSELW